MAAEELEALQAIYCNPGEVEVLQLGGAGKETIFTAKVKSDVDSSLMAQVTMVLPESYPDQIGQFSIMCDALSRQICELLRRDIESFSKSLVGQPMLMDLILWLQSHIHKYRKDETTTTSASDNSDSLWTYVCHLDHMRAKTQYVKTIQKWTSELALAGCLLFYDRWIFIVLEGEQSQIKEYIIRQRTVSVDVDSKGRPCKERMFTVLAQEPISDRRCRLESFEVKDVKSLQELETLFKDIELNDVFDQTVHKLIIQR